MTDMDAAHIFSLVVLSQKNVVDYLISEVLMQFVKTGHSYAAIIHLPKEKIDMLSVMYTANILTVLSTAFGSVMFPTVIWLCRLPPKTPIELKLQPSMSLSVMGTAVGCDNHCQITVGNVTQPMTVNWL